ncbi:phosphopantetheine-binding protein, partial [Plantactinospora endophytica]
DPDQLVGRLPLLDDTHQHQVVGEWSRRIPAELLRSAAPAADTRVYLLDPALRPVPAGVTGEVYLTGAPERPVGPVRLMADPFAGDGSVMYRPGRLGRWSPEGELTMTASPADQVTVRGLRVDPDVVLAALDAHPGIARSAVLARTLPSGVPGLVAYLQPEPGYTVDRVAVLRHLRTRLPGYMVPSLLLPLAELPTTADGEVDRAALSEVTAEPGPAPQDPTEQTLCGLFAEVLGVAGVGPGDDFFDLGGNSLLATQLAARVRTGLSADCTARDIFDSPTPAELAVVVRSGAPGTASAGNGSPAPAKALAAASHSPAPAAAPTSSVIEDILPL